MTRACVIDGKKFNNSHHTIPRCYGGDKSPQVDLCYDCHTDLHTLANRMIKAYTSTEKDASLYAFGRLQLHNMGVKYATDKQLLELITYSIYVFRAHQATLNDLDRQVTLTVQNVPVKYLRELDIIKVKLGLKNRRDVLIHMINSVKISR